MLKAEGKQSLSACSKAGGHLFQHTAHSKSEAVFFSVYSRQWKGGHLFGVQQTAKGRPSLQYTANSEREAISSLYSRQQKGGHLFSIQQTVKGRPSLSFSIQCGAKVRPSFSVYSRQRKGCHLFSVQQTAEGRPSLQYTANSGREAISFSVLQTAKGRPSLFARSTQQK